MFIDSLACHCQMDKGTGSIWTFFIHYQKPRSFTTSTGHSRISWMVSMKSGCVITWIPNAKQITAWKLLKWVNMNETNHSLDLFEKSWSEFKSFGNSRLKWNRFETNSNSLWTNEVPTAHRKPLAGYKTMPDESAALTNWMTRNVFLARLLQTTVRSTARVVLPDCWDESIINRLQLWQTVSNLLWWVGSITGELLWIMNLHFESTGTTFDMMPSSFWLLRSVLRSQV